jgi:hypothetical protein
MISAKFKIGQKITSKKTGLPAIGTVKAITDAAWYMQGAPDIETVLNTNQSWSNLYPDWLDKPMYTIEFLQPQRNISFQEFKNAFANKYQYLPGFDLQSIDERLLLTQYNKIPLLNAVAYPEDDLESYEEE